MAEVVSSHPDRFLGAAQLPMQDVDLAVSELERAVRELGLVGAYVGTDFGRTFDDPGLDPFWSAAVELDVPVFVHPAPSGIDAPARDDRLRRYDLDLTLGFCYEETLAVACLCYGGVLDRHPRLDVCVSHGGGASALMAHRLHHAGATRPWARGRSVDVLAALRRLWFDNHVHDAAALELLERRVGCDRLVVGTNLAGWDGPDGPGDIASAPEYDANARRLLRLDR
jgi:aminocarboxymuconate-semialdehyde decarboxylase